MADALFEREILRVWPPPERAVGEHLSIPATDGFPLGATLARATTHARGAVVIAPATGVKRSYYAAFQTWLARNGFDVVTFDYRGVGGSRPPTLDGFEARMRDWGEKDLAGVLQWTEQELSPRSLLVVGHSVGGQLLGLASNNEMVDGMLCVGSQSGDYRLWPAPARYRMALFFYALLPALTTTWGYLPGGLAGEELPRGVALEWARWCRTDGYLLGGRGSARRESFAKMKAPLLAIGFDDDPYAPPLAVAGLLDLYPEASRERWQIDPRARHLGEVGHFGFFRQRFESTLWTEARDWLGDRAEGLPQRAGDRDISSS